MYLEHFGLREGPFSNAPDLRFVYMGAHHEQALAYLLDSVEAHAGVVLLTGESGVGKTTTCRVLLNRLPERVDVALILNPVPTPAELVSVICDEFGCPTGWRCPPRWSSTPSTGSWRSVAARGVRF